MQNSTSKTDYNSNQLFSYIHEQLMNICSQQLPVLTYASSQLTPKVYRISSQLHIDKGAMVLEVESCIQESHSLVIFQVQRFPLKSQQTSRLKISEKLLKTFRNDRKSQETRLSQSMHGIPKCRTPMTRMGKVMCSYMYIHVAMEFLFSR